MDEIYKLIDELENKLYQVSLDDINDPHRLQNRIDTLGSIIYQRLDMEGEEIEDLDENLNEYETRFNQIIEMLKKNGYDAKA